MEDYFIRCLHSKGWSDKVARHWPATIKPVFLCEAVRCVGGYTTFSFEAVHRERRGRQSDGVTSPSVVVQTLGVEFAAPELALMLFTWFRNALARVINRNTREIGTA